MVNKLDPVLRRAVFLGWSQSMSTEKRVEHMDKFMKEKCSTYRVVDFGHEYTGPYNNRKLSSVSWVEFSNNDVTKAFVKKNRDRPNRVTSRRCKCEDQIISYEITKKTKT